MIHSGIRRVSFSDTSIDNADIADSEDEMISLTENAPEINITEAADTGANGAGAQVKRRSRCVRQASLQVCSHLSIVLIQMGNKVKQSC